VAVKFFWLILAVVVVLVIVLIWRGFTSPRKRPVAPA
jgi:hypothetical protein